MKSLIANASVAGLSYMVICSFTYLFVIFFLLFIFFVLYLSTGSATWIAPPVLPVEFLRGRCAGCWRAAAGILIAFSLTVNDRRGKARLA